MRRTPLSLFIPFVFVGAVLSGVCVSASAGERPAPRVRGIRWPVFDPDTGLKEWELVAETARQLPGNVFAVTKPRIELLANRGDEDQPDKDDLHITADTGRFDRDAEVVKLSGNVVLTMKDRQHTRVEAIEATWDAANHIATSPEDVLVSNDTMMVTGRGFAFAPAQGADNDQPAMAIVRRDVRALLKGTSMTSRLFNPMGSAGKDDADETEQESEAEIENIIVTCEGALRVDRTRNTVRFNRNVRAEKGDSWLTCERLTIQSDPKTDKLHLMLAAGSVVMIAPSRDSGGSGDRLLWRASEAAGRLSGAPAVTWMQQIRIGSPVITFSTQNKRIVWDKRASMKLVPIGLNLGSNR